MEKRERRRKQRELFWQSSEDIGLKPSVCFSGMTLYWNITQTVCVCVCSASCWGCVLSLMPSGFSRETHTHTHTQTHTEEKPSLWIYCVFFHFHLFFCMFPSHTNTHTHTHSCLYGRWSLQRHPIMIMIIIAIIVVIFSSNTKPDKLYLYTNLTNFKKVKLLYMEE